jgi:hypothetical protein
MSSFVSVARNHEFNVKDTQRSGLSELEQFGISATQRYMQNASRIRDSRFANSRAANMDSAMRENRERVISDTIYNSTDPRQLAGLHGRVRANLTRTGDSLANFKPSLQTDDLPSSISDSSLAKRDVMEIARRAEQSSIVAAAADPAVSQPSMYQSVFQSLGYKQPAKPSVATATSRLSTNSATAKHHAPGARKGKPKKSNDRTQIHVKCEDCGARLLKSNLSRHKQSAACRNRRLKQQAESASSESASSKSTYMSALMT